MIQIENLNKQFGSHTIFEQFNLEVKPMEMIAITGKSGTGKSTLLNIIGAVEAFESGTVIVDGIDVKHLKGEKLRNYLKNTITFIFQNYAMMYNKTVMENILLLNDQKDDKEAALKALEKVGLKGFEDRKVDELSGGEQQRVALARAIIRDTKVILADEPTGNLDTENEAIVYEVLQDFAKQGKSVLVATHDLENLHRFDRVIKL